MEPGTVSQLGEQKIRWQYPLLQPVLFRLNLDEVDEFVLLTIVVET
jgi:hypothetical protein